MVRASTTGKAAAVKKKPSNRIKTPITKAKPAKKKAAQGGLNTCCVVMDEHLEHVARPTLAKLVPLSAFVAQNVVHPARFTDTGMVPPGRLLSPPQLPLDVAPSASAPAMSAWPREYMPRELISLCALTMLGIHLLYFSLAGLSYHYTFNHDLMHFFPGQVKTEIRASLRAFPAATLLTLPWFEAQVLGCSRLYGDVGAYGYLTCPLTGGRLLFKRE
ncbi:hypothetical protein B0H17DRAFT_1197264 [Mycena rosella]|uniref:Uncharacterized protein n=1 Tax=Mycena rosella TaxID=1033263 RepID=A0AAD7DRT5_MYCRO|nr:hypothetical protein B0H17DRAFT_1197264 [Mycena rosella]